MTNNSGILKGMTVLDCSQILAGPYCSMILADMGARVIKIEKPKGGDDIRTWGPFKNGESVGFMNLNRNKESIVIDFKSPEGIDVMKSLVKKSDVIIENYRTGTMEKLGLGYEELKKINNKIIYCSISGFGRTGPYSKRAGFDLVAQGMSGLMSITGHPDNPPAKVGVPIADLNTGMFALSAIEAAYINLLKNDKGQYIEVSLLESALAYTVWESPGYFFNNEIPEPLGSAHRVSAPYQALKTKDGFLNVAAPNQSNWERLCDAIDREDLKSNKNFIDNTERMKNIKDLEKELEITFMKKNRFGIELKQGPAFGEFLKVEEICLMSFLATGSNGPCMHTECFRCALPNGWSFSSTHTTTDSCDPWDLQEPTLAMMSPE